LTMMKEEFNSRKELSHAGSQSGIEDIDQETLAKLYEQSFQTFQEGEVVRGRVVYIAPEYVVVDIGYKSEGIIPIDEFKDHDGNVNVRVGDEIEVLLEFHDDEECVVYRRSLSF